MPALSGSRKCLLVNRLQMRRWEMQRQLTQVCWLKNRRVHGMGPKRELMGRAFRMAGLLWFQGKCGAKEHPHTCRCLIYREGLPKRGSGDDVHSVITTAYTIYWRFDPIQFTSLKTCLNLFTWDPIPSPLLLTSSGGQRKLYG